MACGGPVWFASHEYILQAMLGDQGVMLVIDSQATVEIDAQAHALPAIGLRHAVTIASHLNVTIPGNLTQVPVAGVEAHCR